MFFGIFCVNLQLISKLHVFYMTLNKTNFTVILASVSMLTSCLKDDTEIVTYNDAAITTFRLGTVKCTPYGDTKAYSYSAYSHPIIIDQNNNRIYSSEPLIYGTDLSKVLVTVNTVNGGVVFIKNLTADDTYTLYSASDSVDLSKDREFRVMSNDGKILRDYNVHITVQPEPADSFSWDNVQANMAAEISQFTAMKTVLFNEKIYLLGSANGTVSMMNATDCTDWATVEAPAGVTLTEGCSMAAYDGALYLLNGGKLYYTANGSAWTEVATDSRLKTIIGGCNKELYATDTDNAFMVSQDKGATWQSENISDSEAGKLPASDISAVVASQPTYNGVDVITVIGKSSDASVGDAMIWNKYVDAADPQQWMYTPFSEHNVGKRLHNMLNLSATPYAGGILAVGGACNDSNIKPYKQVFFSSDKGLTWHTTETMNLPVNFYQGCTIKTSSIVSDGKGYFYIISSQRRNGTDACVIIRGRKNSETWDVDQKVFQ